MGSSPSVPEKSIHEFTDSRGQDVNLSIYKGKVLLVVNVASKCGFTDSNYTQLTDLYNKYKDKGFEILAFPCNQFMKQEPGTSEDAQNFACTRYKAEYPIFQKVRVNGPNAAPVYRFLKASKLGFMGNRIKWNFTKFLVDKDGHVLDRYSTTTTPMAIEADIKKALGENHPIGANSEASPFAELYHTIRGMGTGFRTWTMAQEHTCRILDPLTPNRLAPYESLPMRQGLCKVVSGQRSNTAIVQ
ncbi:unnamed protein product [Dovyalis caffra]|uniref:Glutathione peroxidase n=1 Tax=Dovyalis caffra TaxID=77055 RepID=A0AAV1SCQ4_9ROSI|nr:unnamed protein product [Dovyalis caffra]